MVVKLHVLLVLTIGEVVTKALAETAANQLVENLVRYKDNESTAHDDPETWKMLKLDIHEGVLSL